MYAAVVWFGSGCGLDTENRPACGSAIHYLILTVGHLMGHEDCIKVFILLLRIVAAILPGFPAINGEKVCSSVIGPERLEEPL